MELIITNRKRLEQKYGPSGWLRIQTAIDEYRAALIHAGFGAELFSIDDLMPAIQITPDLASEPSNLKIILRGLQEEYSSQYILLLGGDDIIPFYRLPDKTMDQDIDGDILSDTYYTDFNANELYHQPKVAIGRLPDGSPGDNLLVIQLKNAAQAHYAGGIKVSGRHSGLTLKCWESVSERTYARIDPTKNTLHRAPPVTRKEVGEMFQHQRSQPPAILYFNVHGDRQHALWTSERRMGPINVGAPILVDQTMLSQVKLSGSVILCEACHGAAIHNGRTTQNSLALCALKQGAVAFFGCTSTSYAITMRAKLQSEPSSYSGIDAFFFMLIFNLLNKRGARRFGDALCTTKEIYSIDNDYDEKNVLSVTLFGDPMLQLSLEGGA